MKPSDNFLRIFYHNPHNLLMRLFGIMLITGKTAKEFFEKIDYEIIREDPILFNEFERLVMRKMLV